MSEQFLTLDEWESHHRLFSDYEYFARHIQRIDPKDLFIDDNQTRVAMAAIVGEDSLQGTIPYIFRPGQQKLHAAVTEQKGRLGKVRKALVKPRQVGWSTYILGRAHWLATQTPGFKIHVVSHNKDSTTKFLRRTRKLCLAAPDVITPGRQIENSKEFAFDNGATWSIATAGNPDAMRSDNCHFLHDSEEPYWPDSVSTLAAILPALSSGVGSEGFRESTSKGKGTPWHQFIMEALAGDSQWEVFFDAWYNQPTYRMTPPPGYQFTDEALEEQIRFKLDNAQLYWRAMQIKDLRALWLFRQEYPVTIEDSFQSNAGTLINPDSVNKARKNTQIVLDQHAPLIMGVDPARTGDRTAIVFRQGNVVRKVIVHAKMDDMRLVGILAGFLKDGFLGTKVAKCFIDYAIGEGAASRLRELGFGQQIMVVHFGGQADEPRYFNKRAEMAIKASEWFGDTGEHVSIPDDDDFASDLLAIPDFVQATGSEKLKLVAKDDIKKLFGKSPDISDAFFLTFAYPVQAERIAQLQHLASGYMAHLPKTELTALLSDFNR